MNIRELPCFQRVNWSPDAGERRRFATAMLAGFAVLGLLRTLHHHGLGTGAFVLWGIGVALALGIAPFVLSVALSGFETENLAAGIAANAKG